MYHHTQYSKYHYTQYNKCHCKIPRKYSSTLDNNHPYKSHHIHHKNPCIDLDMWYYNHQSIQYRKLYNILYNNHHKIQYSFPYNQTRNHYHS